MKLFYRISLLLLAVLCGFPVESSAQELLTDGQLVSPQADLSLSSTQVEIGVPVEFSITMPPEYRSEKIKLSVPSEFMNMIQITREPVSSNRETFDGELVFLTDEVSKLPPFTIKGKNELGQSYTIETGMVSPEVAKPVYEASKPDEYTAPDTPEVEWKGILIAGALGALALGVLALALFFIIRKLSRKVSDSRSRRGLIHLSPIDELHAGLRPVYSHELLKQHDINTHYTAISMSIRKYLERSHGFQALEMTDDELERWLAGRKQSPHLEALRPVFQNASLAKFAQFNTSETEIESHLAILRNFEALEEKAEKEREEKRRLEAKQAKAESSRQEAKK